jgi:hypothetical protein
MPNVHRQHGRAYECKRDFLLEAAFALQHTAPAVTRELGKRWLQVGLLHRRRSCRAFGALCLGNAVSLSRLLMM